MRIFRTTFLLVALTLLLMFVGQIFGGRNGMTFGLGIAICMNAFAYFFSDKIALVSSGAQRVSREQVPRLYEVMERLAAKARLPMPKLSVARRPLRTLSPLDATRNTRRWRLPRACLN